MNIRSALLCIDCDEIFDATEHKNCPCCTSSQHVAIADYVPSLPLNSILCIEKREETVLVPKRRAGIFSRLNSLFWSSL